MLHEVNFSRAAFDKILQQIINERECYIFGFYLLNCCECRLLKSRNFFHRKRVSSELWRSYVRANQFLFSYAKSIAFMISFQLKADTFQFYNKHDLLEILQMPRSLPNSKWEYRRIYNILKLCQDIPWQIFWMPMLYCYQVLLQIHNYQKILNFSMKNSSVDNQFSFIRQDSVRKYN